MLQTITSFISADLRVAAPILIAALGLVYMERSGVVNIGAEGTMLIGALVGSIASYMFGNPWFGMLFAGISGMIVGLLFALLVVSIKVNQIVAGIAFNILAVGITTTVSRIVFGFTINPSLIPGFTVVPIPFLRNIPIIGPSLFSQMVPVYCALMFVPITHVIMQRTSVGLSIRAVGEHPKAADTAGLPVYAIRYGTIIFGSAIVGISGSYLSLGLLHIFTENMTAGRGYIALAAVIFGKWNPWGILLAALLFGFGDALQIRLQAAGSSVPYQFLLMLPYLLTVAALAGLVGKAQSPAASGKPYQKEES